MIPLHNQRFLIITLIVFGFLLVCVIQMEASIAFAADLPMLWLNPTQASAPKGGIVKVVLQLDNISNVYGAQVSLSYDPSVITVVDADPGMVGVQINPGSCPQPDFVVVNNADNNTGLIEYAATQLSPTLPCDGGELATITFRCLIQDSISQVIISESIIADPNLTPIGHSTQHGTIICLAGDQIYIPIVIMMD
jgi:hypothetical protein